MSKKDMYVQTENIVNEYYADRLRLHSKTKDVHLDDSIFDIAKFRKEVLEKYGILLGNDQYIYELTFLAAEKNSFSPIEDYLSQTHDAFEGIDYSEMFSQLAIEGLHIDPDSIGSKYLSKTLIGAVARIFEPGVKFDQALVLYGKQGYFKTSFFEVLAGEEYFTSIHLQNFDKDERMICQSKWFIELGEVEQSIKRAQMGKIKQFLSERSDSFRKPYGKQVVTIPRSFILVGSTNKREFLLDETGNRRFWVIELNEKINIDWVKANRDQIWAAAVAAYLANEPIYLNELEQEMSNRQNKQFEKEDIWHPVIAEWVTKRGSKPFTMAEIVSSALSKEVKQMNNLDQARVSQILQQLGYEKPTKTTRVNDKPGRYWTVKEEIAA
jgi:predicted P-loop ATPase